MKFRLHHESSVLLNAPAERAFAYLDDFRALSEHMAKPSAMMGMTPCFKAIVIQRQPPLRKAWQTVDAKLLVIGQYRLGFDISPNGNGAALRVFIDYDLPAKRAISACRVVSSTRATAGTRPSSGGR